jgi:hypothetical protein
MVKVVKISLKLKIRPEVDEEALLQMLVDGSKKKGDVRKTDGPTQNTDTYNNNNKKESINKKKDKSSSSFNSEDTLYSDTDNVQAETKKREDEEDPKIIREVYQLFSKDIDQQTFSAIVQKVMANKSRNFKNYLITAVMKYVEEQKQKHTPPVLKWLKDDTEGEPSETVDEKWLDDFLKDV